MKSQTPTDYPFENVRILKGHIKLSSLQLVQMKRNQQGKDVWMYLTQFQALVDSMFGCMHVSSPRNTMLTDAEMLLSVVDFYTCVSPSFGLRKLIWKSSKANIHFKEGIECGP